MNKIIKKLNYSLILVVCSFFLIQCKSAEFTFLGIFSKKYDHKSILTKDIERYPIKFYEISKDSTLPLLKEYIIKDSIGILSGKVIDYQTNTPVEKAKITIYGYYPIYTDSVGCFKIKDIKKGDNYVIIEKEGYVSNSEKVEIINGWELKLSIKLIKINTPVKIGVNGGDVYSSDGAKIHIPKNALKKETEISITKVPIDAYFLGLSSVFSKKPFINIYKLFPDGLNFESEISISIPILNEIKGINGQMSKNFQSLHINSTNFDPQKLTEEISSINKISDNGDTLYLQVKKFPNSMIWPLCPPGFLICNGKCGTWEIGTNLTATSPQLQNCGKGDLTVSIGLTWYFGSEFSITLNLEAPCCKSISLFGSVQTYDMHCTYDLCNYFGAIISEDYFWQTKHKSDNLIVQQIINNCCEGSIANPVCCNVADDQCYEWKCKGGAPIKIEKPICEECRKLCMECDPLTGNCINFKCTDNEQCCNGVCKPKEFECSKTTTIVSCNGGILTSNPSTEVFSCSGSYSPPPCESTGKIEYSQGVCTGGSMVTVCYSGPFLKPCT